MEYEVADAIEVLKQTPAVIDAMLRETFQVAHLPGSARYIQRD